MQTGSRMMSTSDPSDYRQAFAGEILQWALNQQDCDRIQASKLEKFLCCSLSLIHQSFNKLDINGRPHLCFFTTPPALQVLHLQFCLQLHKERGSSQKPEPAASSSERVTAHFYIAFCLPRFGMYYIKAYAFLATLFNPHLKGRLKL